MINFYKSLLFLFIALVISFAAHGQWVRSTGEAGGAVCFVSVPGGAGETLSLPEATVFFVRPTMVQAGLPRDPGCLRLV